MTRDEVLEQLKNWVHERNPDAEVEPNTPLLEQKLLSSLQVTELLLFIEELRRSPIDIEALQPGTFHDLNAICDTFWPETRDG